MSTSTQLAIRQASAKRMDDLTGWIADLVRIPSITGNEHAAQEHVATLMTQLGLQVETIIPDDAQLRSHPSFSDDGLPTNRPVVIGRRSGGNGTSYILNGHMDVVPTGDETQFPEGAWSGNVKDGSLWGRGSCDMKAGLLTGLAALAVLDDLGLETTGDVTLESVTGEETGGVGTLATVVNGITADAAIILEPTQLASCPVGAGAASFRLHVHGKAAHGAMREDGVSAVSKYTVLHEALQRLETHRHQGWVHPAYAAGTLVAPIAVGTITAGDWPSTVPELLVAEGRYGVLPGESLQQARAAFEQAVAAAASEDEWLAAHPPTVQWFEGQFAPANTPLDAPLLQNLAQAHHAVLGASPTVEGVTYGSDLRFFTNDLAMPAVLYGPGDVAFAHSVNEHVPLDQVQACTEVVANLLLAKS